MCCRLACTVFGIFFFNGASLYECSQFKGFQQKYNMLHFFSSEAHPNACKHTGIHIILMTIKIFQEIEKKKEKNTLDRIESASKTHVNAYAKMHLEF